MQQYAGAMIDRKTLPPPLWPERPPSSSKWEGFYDERGIRWLSSSTGAHTHTVSELATSWNLKQNAWTVDYKSSRFFIQMRTNVNVT